MKLAKFLKGRKSKALSDLLKRWNGEALAQGKLLLRERTRTSSSLTALLSRAALSGGGFLRADGIKTLLGRVGFGWPQPHQRFSSDDSEVPELDESNFHEYVRKHGKVFVMWYDPFCPACRRASVDFEKFFVQMRSELAFGAVDSLKNDQLAVSQSINAFPTFRLYVCNGQCSYKSHEGPLNIGEMKSFVAKCSPVEPQPNQTTSTVQTRQPVASKSSLLNLLNHRSKRPIFLQLKPETETKQSFSSACLPSVTNSHTTIKVGKTTLALSPRVMQVNGHNFEEKIRAFDSALVYFYAKWCAQCGQSLSEYVQAVEEIEDSNGVLAICNAEDSLEIVDKYFVGQIPTLKYFRKGRYITDYIGEIKKELLVQFMKGSQNDENFLLTVTKHKPLGEGLDWPSFTPTQKKRLWEGKDGSDMIVHVTTENLDRVLSSHKSMLLLFYACWSRICVGLKGDYINVAKAVERSDVVLAACDCEEHVEVADRFLISKFPTLKYFRDGKPVRDFSGDYQTESILQFLNDPGKLQVASRDSPKSVKLQEDVGVPDYWRGVEGGNKILHFSDFNYKKLLETNPAVLLMFYVPWCKPCTIMKREFGKAALQCDPSAGLLAACNAERNNEMADVFAVTKLPTLKYFKNGKYVRDYVGKRTAQDFCAFLKDSKSAEKAQPAQGAGTISSGK